jgi:lipopolysaccharide cholinephosphotransferase
MGKTYYTSNEEGLTVSKKLCFELLKIVDTICKENNLHYWLDGGTLLAAKRHKGFIPWDDDVDVCLVYDEYEILIERLKDFVSTSGKHILFHSDTDFSFCYDFFGDVTHLRNGLTPSRIDITPVKIIPNNPEAIKKDKSLYNILSLYFQGKMKDASAVLPEHEYLLPKTGVDVIKSKNAFFDFYIPYMKVMNRRNAVGQGVLLTYCINDVKVKRERAYYQFDEVFPLTEVEFEGRFFNAPNNWHNYLVILYGEDYLTPPPENQRFSQFNKLYINTLPNYKIKFLLNKFYYFGFLNFNLPDYQNQSKRKLLMIQNFIRLSLILAFRLEFGLLRCFWRYVYFKVNR